MFSLPLLFWDVEKKERKNTITSFFQKKNWEPNYKLNKLKNAPEEFIKKHENGMESSGGV